MQRVSPDAPTPCRELIESVARESAAKPARDGAVNGELSLRREECALSFLHVVQLKRASAHAWDAESSSYNNVLLAHVDFEL
jgi:hypothetical protein